MFSSHGKKRKHTPEETSVIKEEQVVTVPAENRVACPIEENEDVIHIPPVAAPFFGLTKKIAYFGFSQKGKSHIESETPCQDRCYGEYVHEANCLILAIADGVGSCALSDLGADTAVHSIVDYIRKELLKNSGKRIDSTLAGVLLRNAMQFAYDQVQSAAESNEQLLYSLQSTLTVAVYDGSDLFFAHAGDDGIVALTQEGKLALATNRHKGEEASSVYPLQSKHTWQFGMVPNTIAFVMATDGVLDAFVRNSFENNRVYYPFLEPIFAGKYGSEQDVEQMCSDLYDYMNSEEYRSQVTDDLTFTVAMNLSKITNCLPEFDVNAWNEETKIYDEKRQKALYSQKTEEKKGRTGKGEWPANANDEIVAKTFRQQGSPCTNSPVEALSGSDCVQGNSGEWTNEKLREKYSNQNPHNHESGSNRNCGGKSRPLQNSQKTTSSRPYMGPQRTKRKTNNNWGPMGLSVVILVGIVLLLLMYIGIRMIKLLVTFLLMFL